RDASCGEAFTQGCSRLRAGIAGVREDSHALNTLRPLPLPHSVGGERSPCGSAEDRLGGKSCLDAFRDTEVAIAAEGKKPDGSAGDRPEHLLAGRRFARAI